MRIKSLQLHNFRQFYGTTPRIEFSAGDKNATIIHASNGAGKTALLNALTWTLYEKHSAGFLLPEQLVNKRAIREASDGANVEAWVELHFDHDSIKYVVKRSCVSVRSPEGTGLPVGGSEVTMQASRTDGDWNTVKNPENTIGKILPDALHGYFFFDGERIEKIVSPDKKESAELAKATKMLLGVEALVRAERHLNDAKKEFENELRNIGDSGTKDLLEEKADFEQESLNVKSRLEELEKNIDAENQRKKVISSKLRELETAKALQARRDSLLSEQENRKESQKQNLEMQKNLISRKAYTVFLGNASAKFSSLLEELEKKGELPAGIKVNFVNDLLENKKCICGTPLSDENSNAYQAVVGWRNRAGLADVEAQAIRMQGELTVINGEVSSFWEQMHGIQLKQKSDRDELSRIEDELDEISSKLKGSPQQEVVDLEKQLENTSSRIDDDKREQAILENDLERLSLKINDLEKSVAQQKQKNSRQRLVQRRINASVDSANLVQELRQIMEKDMRMSLAERIKKLFSKISVTPYIPELNDHYELKLTERAGGSTALVPASQGENQVLSFSFIGAIVEEAKNWAKKKSVIPGPRGCQYPIVMDSPFGALDPRNRRNIAEHLNILADQVILLLTKTQWRGEVETALSSKIGREYVISYHSTKQDLLEEIIQIEGNNYHLVCQSPDDFEYSIIQEA